MHLVCPLGCFFWFFFFFNDTATTEIYTLSLHDALPISWLPSLVAKLKSGAGEPAAGCFCVSAACMKVNVISPAIADKNILFISISPIFDETTSDSSRSKTIRPILCHVERSRDISHCFEREYTLNSPNLDDWAFHARDRGIYYGA